MQEKKAPLGFDEERAASYDEQFAKLSPLKDALHLCSRAALSGAPEDARVLCVGAGTGAEMLYLAGAFPDWRFTLVEPSVPMLDRAREKAERAGVVARCTFHEGYLDSLPIGEPFNVATSILVSQFILEPDARQKFFRGLGGRLVPGGLLVSSDLATRDYNDPGDVLFGLWMELMRFNGASNDALDGYREAMNAGVAVCSPEAIEAYIAAGGFETPVRICQTVLIHTWLARRSST